MGDAIASALVDGIADGISRRLIPEKDGFALLERPTYRHGDRYFALAQVDLGRIS